MTVRLRTKVTASHRLEGYAAAATTAFEEAARLYVDQIIPRHFTNEGASEYGYEPRDAGYTSRKLRAFGHQRPLEFTGETRRRAIAASVRDLGHANAAGAEIVIDVPGYVGDDSTRRREIQKTSRRDRRAISLEVDRILGEKLKGRGPAREIR